jgi:hypothetical protein
MSCSAFWVDKNPDLIPAALISALVSWPRLSAGESRSLRSYPAL